MMTVPLAAVTAGGTVLAAGSPDSGTFIIGLITAITGLIGTIGTLWLAARKKVDVNELAAKVAAQIEQAEPQ